MEIKQENINVEDINDTVGGMSFVKPNEVPKNFSIGGIIIDYSVVETEWGKRYEFILNGIDGNTYPFSSWNFVSKKKYKAFDLLGKSVILKAYNEKKFLLEVMN